MTLSKMACYHNDQPPCDKCRYDIDRAIWVGARDSTLLTVMSSHLHNCDCAACKEYNAKRASQKHLSSDEQVLNRFLEFDIR